MGKRKRELSEKDGQQPRVKAARPISEAAPSSTHSTSSNTGSTVQVIVGSYERTLHGIIAHVPATVLSEPAPDASAVTFADSFLFNAHTASVRCLALSPPSEANKVFLASGGTDERINIYSLTTVAPPKPQAHHSNGAKAAGQPALHALSRPTAMSAANKDIGTLNHHAATVTSLSFPTRTKLLSGAADNSIAVLRTRDWEVLSSLRAPVPKAVGRPSGDTAAPGDVPAGINDIAIHPSLKLMLTVGRGEKCMRLWNLVTGKKAGVLQFDKNLLAQVGEGKYASGEGRRALWDAEGESYVILFERGACVFGIDSKPKAVIRPHPPTKLHQIQYLEGQDQNILVASTEDGRLLFYDVSDNTKRDLGEDATKTEHAIPVCSAIAQLGGRDSGVASRIKDFAILRANAATNDRMLARGADVYLAITASSDGAVQVWTVAIPAGQTSQPQPASLNGDVEADAAQSATPPSTGNLIGMYETGSRITCLKAFIMDGKIEDEAEGEAAALDGARHTDASSVDDDSDESE